jgi:hypothetical protein
MTQFKHQEDVSSTLPDNEDTLYTGIIKQIAVILLGVQQPLEEDKKEV